MTRKVHVLVENEEFQLPEDQKSFNELLRKYPGLIYSLFKVSLGASELWVFRSSCLIWELVNLRGTLSSANSGQTSRRMNDFSPHPPNNYCLQTFSEHSIPFVFDELTGELRLLINDRLNFHTVTLAIDGKNYSLPSQWKEIENDTEAGLIVQPAKVIQLLNEHNVTIPVSVLEVLKSHIRLSISPREAINSNSTKLTAPRRHSSSWKLNYSRETTPMIIRRRHTLQLRIKGRAGRLTYFLTLPDGR